MEYTISELHCHTSESSHCGNVSAADLVPLFKEKGYDLICITDHYNLEYFPDTYDTKEKWDAAVDYWFKGWKLAKETGDKIGLCVLHGVEIRFLTEPNDYLVYGMTDEMYYEYPELFKLTPKEFSEFSKEHGLLFIQAHPFRPGQSRCNPEYLDGMEAYNSHPYHNAQNPVALEYAKENHLIPTCGQDFHQYDAMLGCKTRFYGEVKDIPTLISKIRNLEYDMILPNGEIIKPTIN